MITQRGIDALVNECLIGPVYVHCYLSLFSAY